MHERLQEEKRQDQRLDDDEEHGVGSEWNVKDVRRGMRSDGGGV